MPGGVMLPRAYWCHADLTSAPFRPYGPPRDLITTAPGEAVEWLCDSVRAVVPWREWPLCHGIPGRLGHHRTVRAAVRELRRGRPYDFGLMTPAGGCVWTIRPVSVLPTADH
ncbi:hypothetical protein ACWF94_02865 [Streptomyces sp. NPDC055078]